MSIRDDTFAKFGPLLLEALVDELLLEINELRTAANLPPKKKTDILTSTNSRLTEAADFEWMNQEP